MGFTVLIKGSHTAPVGDIKVRHVLLQARGYAVEGLRVREWACRVRNTAVRIFDRAKVGDFPCSVFLEIDITFESLNRNTITNIKIKNTYRFRQLKVT